MADNQIVLILGAGPRVGLAVASKFAGQGYTVAIASRKGINDKTPEGFLSLQADFTKPDSIPGLFDAVKKLFGAAPNVVVYNAAGMTMPPVKDAMFSVEAQSFALDLNINVVSPYVAAQQAVSAWDSMQTENKKTFIYTGNILNKMIVPMPMMLDLGVGKAASAYWLGLADAMFSAKGYRFFYADERDADGKMKGMALDGPAHGEFYAFLANTGGKDVPWQATFVKDQGYVKFSRKG